VVDTMIKNLESDFPWSTRLLGLIDILSSDRPCLKDGRANGDRAYFYLPNSEENILANSRAPEITLAPLREWEQAASKIVTLTQDSPSYRTQSGVHDHSRPMCDTLGGAATRTISLSFEAAKYLRSEYSEEVLSLDAQRAVLTVIANADLLHIFTLLRTLATPVAEHPLVRIGPIGSQDIRRTLDQLGMPQEQNTISIASLRDFVARWRTRDRGILVTKSHSFNTSSCNRGVAVVLGENTYSWLIQDYQPDTVESYLQEWARSGAGSVAVHYAALRALQRADFLTPFQSAHSLQDELTPDIIDLLISRGVLKTLTSGDVVLTGEYAGDFTALHVLMTGLKTEVVNKFETWLAMPHEWAAKTSEPRPDFQEMIESGESATAEFKSTVWVDLHRRGTPRSKLQNEVLQAIAGLANSRKGGYLLIGVADDRTIVGLKHDYHTMKKPGRDDFQSRLRGLFAQFLGSSTNDLVTFHFPKIEGEEICAIRVEPATSPIYFSDQKHSVVDFYVRFGNTTRKLSVDEAVQYVSERFQR